MKRIINIVSFIFITIVFLQATISVFAITPTPTSNPKASPNTTTNPTDAQDLDRIKKIKDLVASKVAELKLVEKRGILGIVKEANSTQITITDIKDAIRIIDIDELTKFQKDSGTTSFGISDIKNGASISFIGLYNKETKRLLARFVAKSVSIPLSFEGIVTSKDTKKFIFTLIDDSGNKKIADVSSSTKTSFYTKADGTTKSGFSKVEIGQRMVVIGFADLKDKDTINSERIIYFNVDDVPPSANMKKQQEIANLDTNPPVSSGSGVKIQPIKK